jgi:ornithine cyclodeaminase
MRVVSLDEIKDVLPSVELMDEIEQGFIAYSKGESVVPPVGELVIQKPPGDVHIKYGYLKGDDFYVIKIASGFYENSLHGLPTSNGMMLIFSQKTGVPQAILLDEGYLTDIRTAIAGAIAAKYLAPGNVTRIGIVGTGMQARLQLEYLLPVTACRDVLVWGRDQSKLDRFVAEMEPLGLSLASTTTAADILRSCNLIVTTTPSHEPILSGPVMPGTHITAVGSDTPEKQELGVDILAAADVVVADSISQCLLRGEIHKALNAGSVTASEIVELGGIISGDAVGRVVDEQVTVADLTGVAVQDVQIATAVFHALR